MNKATKTIPQILRDNICTVFNLLNLMIAVALAAVGAWKNMLFIFIILINTAVGIVQEIKAKRQIERPFCLCTLRMVSNHSEGTFGRLRYTFGGDRPSQTPRQTLSPRRLTAAG